MSPRSLLPATLVCFTVLAGTSSAEAAFIRRGQITKKGTLRYYRTTVTVQDDDSSEVDSVDLTLTDELGDSLSAVLEPVSASGAGVIYQAEVDAGPGTWTMAATMLDAKGQPLGDTFETTVIVPDTEPQASTDFTLDAVTIEQIDEEYFQLTVDIGSDPQGEVGAVAISFGDFAGPEPTEPDFTIKDSGGNGPRSTFTTEALSFEEADAAIGETYEVVVDFLSPEGEPLGSETVDVVILGL